MKRKPARRSGCSVEPLEIRYMLSAPAAVSAVPVATATVEIVPQTPVIANDGMNKGADPVEISASPGVPQSQAPELIVNLPQLSNAELDSVITELISQGDFFIDASHREDATPAANSRVVVQLPASALPPAQSLSSLAGGNAPFVLLQPRDDMRWTVTPDKLDASFGLLMHGAMPPFAMTHDVDFRNGLIDVRGVSRELTSGFMLFRSFEAISSSLASVATLPCNGHVLTQQAQALLIADGDDKAAFGANLGSMNGLKEGEAAQSAFSIRTAPKSAAHWMELQIAQRLASEDSNYADQNSSASEQQLAQDESIADVDEPSLVPEQIAGVQNYLGIDWNGLESRMSDFLSDLEAAGSKLRSGNGTQTHVAFLWISVTAVATFVLEWACRKSCVPAVERNVYGVLNDRSSVSRQKGYETGGPRRVS